MGNIPSKTQQQMIHVAENIIKRFLATTSFTSNKGQYWDKCGINHGKNFEGGGISPAAKMGTGYWDILDMDDTVLFEK